MHGRRKQTRRQGRAHAMRAWILVSSDATARRGRGHGESLWLWHAGAGASCWTLQVRRPVLLEMRCEKRRTRRAAAFSHPVPMTPTPRAGLEPRERPKEKRASASARPAARLSRPRPIGRRRLGVGGARTKTNQPVAAAATCVADWRRAACLRGPPCRGVGGTGTTTIAAAHSERRPATQKSAQNLMMMMIGFLQDVRRTDESHARPRVVF